MKIYHYHETTGEFLGADTADSSPLEPGVFLIPRNATQTQPPETGPDEVAVWREGAWEKQEDHRGKKVWTEDDWDDRGSVVIKDLGPIPRKLKLIRPAVPEQVRARRDASSALFEIREAMRTVWSELPLPVRDAFLLDRLAISSALDDDDIELAIHRIQNLTATTPDEHAAKRELLAIVAPLTTRPGKSNGRQK